MKRYAYLPVLVLSLAACSNLSQPYEQPKFDLPAPAARSVQIDRQWWRAYGSHHLNELVEEALKNNWDLAKAAASVAEARAAVASAQSLLVPRVDGVAQSGASRRKWTIGSSDNDIERTTVSNSVGVAVSWEIDLWDRIGQMNAAALARLASSEHTQDAVNLSISSLVVDAWLQLRALDYKLLITKEVASSLKQAANLEYRRWKADVGTELAYSQSLAEYAATEARVPGIDTAISQTEMALKLLTGRSPRVMGDVVPRNLAPMTVPVTPKEVDSLVLLRRPDVASAEQLLVAANADVNSARAEFYPRLTLSAVIGFVASTSSAISGVPLFWDLSAGLVGPIFDGGLVQSKVDAAQARKQRALAHYQYTVSAAFRDAYQSILMLDTTDRQVKSMEEEVATRQRAKVLAEKSYDAGRSSKFEVLGETVRVLNSQLFLVDAKYYQLAARSQYYKALGGGF